jgi:hypothetical protein
MRFEKDAEDIGARVSQQNRNSACDDEYEGEVDLGTLRKSLSHLLSRPTNRASLLQLRTARLQHF